MQLFVAERLAKLATKTDFKDAELVSRWRQYLDKAAELDPKHTMAYYNRGGAYLGQQQYDNAISDYNTDIELNPKFAVAHSNRGIAYLFKAEYDRAISEFTRAMQIDASDTTITKIRMMCSIGRV